MVGGSIGSVSLAESKVAGCARRISFLSLEAKAMNLTSCSKATGGCPNETRSCERFDNSLIVNGKCYRFNVFA